jgi:hypothetical protein
MESDRDRLTFLMLHLYKLEHLLPRPHERSILEVARLALRDEISRISHRLYGLQYLQPVAATRRAAV